MGLKKAIIKLKTNYYSRKALRNEAEKQRVYHELHTDVLRLLVQRDNKLKRGKHAVPKRHDWPVDKEELEFARRLAKEINAAKSELQLNSRLGALRERAEWHFDPELTRALVKLSGGKKELIRLMAR
ncbi:MAG: hypothetical protein V1676_04845 [Candidatus Diapherotrites archaeon]